MLIEALILGSALYAGKSTYQQLRQKGGVRWPSGWLNRRPRAYLEAGEKAEPTAAQQQANQTLAISSTSLGLAAAGTVFAMPLLSLGSVPLMLYTFAPTFQSAYHTLRKERRINNQVLDATRILLCVAMRYDLIAAANACLQATSQKFFLTAEESYNKQIERLVGDQPLQAWKYTGSSEVQTALSEIKVGDVVSIAAGDTIPATSVVLYGSAWVDQRIASGDFQLVELRTGDRVLAGSSVVDGQLFVQLEEAPTLSQNEAIRHTLLNRVEQKTWLQQIGERSADRMAPRSMVAFAIALPLLGANQAAAFLTTGFGANMRTLGPLAVRNFLIPAAEHGILIKDARAFELANLTNTIIFDQRVLTDPAVRPQAKAIIHALRQHRWPMTSVSSQRFAIYLMVEEESDAVRGLVAELGLDDYFVEPLQMGRASLLENLRIGGRYVCYIGTGDDDTVMEKANVAIAHRGLETLATNRAHVVLIDNDLREVGRFFDMAAVFAVKQSFNLAAPILLDFVDIATTLFIHFGLIYSVMFNYIGLLIGATNSRFSLPEPARLPVPLKAPPSFVALSGES